MVLQNYYNTQTGNRKGKHVGNKKFTIDRRSGDLYNEGNYIGQFVTILSVNKTKGIDGRSALIFCGHDCAHFLFLESK